MNLFGHLLSQKHVFKSFKLQVLSYKSAMVYLSFLNGGTTKIRLLLGAVEKFSVLSSLKDATRRHER